MWSMLNCYTTTTTSNAFISKYNIPILNDKYERLIDYIRQSSVTKGINTSTFIIPADLST